MLNMGIDLPRVHMAGSDAHHKAHSRSASMGSRCFWRRMPKRRSWTSMALWNNSTASCANCKAPTRRGASNRGCDEGGARAGRTAQGDGNDSEFERRKSLDRSQTPHQILDVRCRSAGSLHRTVCGTKAADE